MLWCSILKSVKSNLFDAAKRYFHTNQQLQGPITGAIAYWVVKGGSYLGIAVAAGAAISTGVPAIAASTGLGAGVITVVGYLASAGTEMAIAVAAGTGTTGTLTIGTLAATAVGSGATTGATTVVSTAMMSGSGSVGIVAGIETASTAVGTFFTCLPFLP